MWVVKIGGSLQGTRYLYEWLEALVSCGGGKVVLVAGGGIYADQVREDQRRYGLDDAVAHSMAIRATERFAGEMLLDYPQLQAVKDLVSIRAALAGNRVPVWLPLSMTESNPALPASWKVTSDSLAAWLALELGFDNLLLVKSCALPHAGCNSVKQLSADGYVDGYLPEICAQTNLNLFWLERCKVGHFIDNFPKYPQHGFPRLSLN